jgi:hypothetical protein
VLDIPVTGLVNSGLRQRRRMSNTGLRNLGENAINLFFGEVFKRLKGRKRPFRKIARFLNGFEIPVHG